MPNENKLITGIEEDMSLTFTENGATAYNTAGAGDLLDLFAISGSLRTRLDDIDSKYVRAIAEDKLNAVKLAFYTRDIREGLGERDAARRMFRVLATADPDAMAKNMYLLPEYGRWDDVVELIDTPAGKKAVELINAQLSEDVVNMSAGRPVSLLAKWLPSANTSSRKTRCRAETVIEALGMTPREYRKTLSALRAYLNVTEVRMTEKDYDSINYAHVPSNAMNRYREAFRKNDKDGFSRYLESLKKGEAKINSGTLYPYDIVQKYTDELAWSYGRVPVVTPDEVLEEQWKALPNYIEGENNYLIMVDVSGSMMGRPIATSVGLGIYFAERNKGAFANTFMTFTDVPQVVRVNGDSLAEKVSSVFSYGVGYNTDLEAAFEAVLRAAVRRKIPAEEMPKSIIVISDGEIDSLTYQTNWGFVDEMKDRFNAMGYELPNLVLWNVESRQDTYHASGYAQNVQMCSGQSATVFKALLHSAGMTPYEYMMFVLGNERYDVIQV